MSAPSLRLLIDRLGQGGPERLDLAEADDVVLGRWLVRCRLRAQERDETRLARALAGLGGAGLDGLGPLAAAPERAAERLGAAGMRRPEDAVRCLTRAAGSLAAHYGGSLERLARAAEGLDDLAGRIVSLAPGLGAATVQRFLAPLRHRWPAASELPLSPAARAAAVHLGWLDPDDDPEWAAGRLASRVREASVEPGAAPLWEVELALDRLGDRACRRDRWRRCPLGADCPRRPTSSE